jgi:hypothetical protein
MILGDSTLFGISVSQENTLDVKLREALDRKLPGSRFEVINVSVPGTTTTDGALWYGRRGAGFRPDLLVVGYNNEEFCTPPEESESLSDALAGFAFDHSQFARILFESITVWRQLHLPYEPRDTRDDNSPTDAYEGSLRRLCGRAAAGGARIVLLSLPEYLEPGREHVHLPCIFREKMKEIAKEKGVYLLDIRNSSGHRAKGAHHRRQLPSHRRGHRSARPRYCGFYRPQL